MAAAMKYAVAIAALTACWLTAASALGQYDDSRFMAEGDAIIQSQQGRPTLPVDKYDPEAAVAAGIKPVPPLPPPQDHVGPGEGPRFMARYNQELNRYYNALERWAQQAQAKAEAEARAQDEANAQAQAKANAQAALDQQRAQDEAMASRIRAARRYPELADPNSEMTRKYLEIVSRLSTEGNPLVNAPDAAERVAEMAFAELNQQFEAASMASRIAAGKRYPQLSDPNSELTRKYLEIVKRLSDEKSPIINDSNASERIADMAASELKIAPKQ
jgi:predicted  nucleic acid-binding Zn-ribbon protein